MRNEDVVGPCALCGSKAWVRPYWRREWLLCSRCCEEDATKRWRKGSWPPVPWESDKSWLAKSPA